MKPYRNTAFLIELLVNVLVLSISCAVLVMVLVDAALRVRDTGRKNAAGNEISTLLQTARVRGLDEIAQGDAGNGFTLYYDEDWQPAAEQDHAFALVFTVEEQATGAGVLQHVSARAETDRLEEICSFATSLYLPDGGTAGAVETEVEAA